MREIKIAVCIPTAGSVRMSFAYSLCGMLTCVAAKGVPTIPDASVTMSLKVLESSNWITNREKLAKQALDAGDTHLMFLDDDMVFEPQVLEVLLGRRQAIVATNYLIKTEPAEHFVAVSLDGQRVATREASTGLMPLSYSGFGVSLISTEVFKKVPQPWFLPDFNAETGDYTTEDNPFFRKARDAGFDVYLDQDASKLVSHVGSKTWNWKEVKHG
jgi:GT2 family glycosyltransferase